MASFKPTQLPGECERTIDAYIEALIHHDHGIAISQLWKAWYGVDTTTCSMSAQLHIAKLLVQSTFSCGSDNALHDGLELLQKYTV